MLRKKLKINESVLAGILIYSVFITVLYFRMKNAEKILADYYDARLCLLPSNCREIIKAKILDYGSEKISFTNYGPKGIPLESGTFEEYLFSISVEKSDTKTVKVLPNTPSDVSGFDITPIYIPTKFDKTIVDSNLFKGKSVFVEIWHHNITLILVAPLTNDINQTNETPLQESVSIGPVMQEVYEIVLPTENHPLIRDELSKNDFTGWTSGLLLSVLSVSIFGGVIIGVINGVSWIIEKGKALKGNTKNK